MQLRSNFDATYMQKGYSLDANRFYFDANEMQSKMQLRYNLDATKMQLLYKLELRYS